MPIKGPSDHLSWVELACKDGTPYPDEFRTDGRAFRLATVFEGIRVIWNKPLVINSAYRTPEWNQKIGGARNSQHVLGRALDIQPPTGVSLREFYNVIRQSADMLGIHGLGLYKTFVHVDIRPTSRLVVWSGNGIKDSGTIT